MLAEDDHVYVPRPPSFSQSIGDAQAMPKNEWAREDIQSMNPGPSSRPAPRKVSWDDREVPPPDLIKVFDDISHF